MRHVHWYRDIKVLGENTASDFKVAEKGGNLFLLNICLCLSITRRHITEDSAMRNICTTPTSSLALQVSDNMPSPWEGNRTYEILIQFLFLQLRLKLNKFYEEKE